MVSSNSICFANDRLISFEDPGVNNLPHSGGLLLAEAAPCSVGALLSITDHSEGLNLLGLNRTAQKSNIVPLVLPSPSCPVKLPQFSSRKSEKKETT
jgi:hypothetical protein